MTVGVKAETKNPETKFRVICVQARTGLLVEVLGLDIVFFGFHSRFLHKLDNGHGGGVAAAETGFQHSGVAALAGGKGRGDLCEELLHEGSAAKDAVSQTAGVDGIGFAVGDHAFDEAAEFLGFGEGGGDLAVFDHGSHKVADHQAAGVLFAPEFSSFMSMSHFSPSFLREEPVCGAGREPRPGARRERVFPPLSVLRGCLQI